MREPKIRQKQMVMGSEREVNVKDTHVWLG